MDKDKRVERLMRAVEHGEKYGSLFLANNEIWADIRAAAAALRSHGSTTMSGAMRSFTRRSAALRGEPVTRLAADARLPLSQGWAFQ